MHILATSIVHNFGGLGEYPYTPLKWWCPFHSLPANKLESFDNTDVLRMTMMKMKTTGRLKANGVSNDIIIVIINSGVWLCFLWATNWRNKLTNLVPGWTVVSIYSLWSHIPPITDEIQKKKIKLIWLNELIIRFITDFQVAS